MSSFMATMTVDQNNATGNGTRATVIFNNVVHDQWPNYNAATGVFTAGTTGDHLFTTAVYFKNVGASVDGGVTFQVNGVDYYVAGERIGNVKGAGNNDLILSGSLLIKLNAMDTVRVKGYAYSTTQTVGFGSAVPSFFSGKSL